MNAPKFTHDCKSCQFLGHFKYRDRDCDFYSCETYCSVIGGERNIIARHGNDGREYASTIFLGHAGITSLDWAVLGRGIDLTDKEKNRLIRFLLNGINNKVEFQQFQQSKDSELIKIPEEEFQALGKNNWIWSEYDLPSTNG